MARILLDACVPHALRRELADLDVETAHFAGLDHLSDSDLLDAIEGRYDVLVTLDRNLAYQQRVIGRAVAVVVLRVASQAPEDFRALVPTLRGAIAAARPGVVVTIG